MYNEELKGRFIREFTTNLGRKKLAETMFNSLEPYEVDWGADVCTIDKERLRPVVMELVGFRSTSKGTRATVLRAYIRWCMKNEVEGACDALLQIKDFGLEKLKRQMVASPGHLQRYLDCICDKESELTTDVTYRCLWWLAYGGVENEEIALKILDSDVDFENMVVRYGNEEFPFYREAIPTLKKCVELTQFRFKHPNYSEVIWRKRADGHQLIRGIRANKSAQSIKVEMSYKARQSSFMTEKDKNDESLQLKLSYYRVWLSGMFYRMYEAERAGMPVDFTAEAKRHMRDKDYKLDSGRNLIGAKERQLARAYEKDYNRWKEAYSI